MTFLLPVALISAAVLAYEVLLIRLFAIVQWHQFAAMAISIALLGFGASGTFLTFARKRLLRHYPVAFATSAALFAVTAVAGFAVAARLPFNALEVVWDPGQLLWLAAEYAVLVPPFFFGGTCIGLAFARAPGRIGRIYAFDLVGAGIGAIGVVGLLFLVFPGTALQLTAALGMTAAALAAAEAAAGRRRWPLAGGLAVAAVALATVLPAGWTDPRPHISQYKSLMAALRVPQARIIAERSSPLGMLALVESPAIPFRHAPGLSLGNLQEPPAQLGVFTDGGGPTPITAFNGDPATIAYLDWTTAALPYHLRARPRVLVLGAGGGDPVLLALLQRAASIDAVEVDRQLIELVSRDFAAFSGNLFHRPDIRLHAGEARSFVAGTDRRWDVIQLAPLDSFGSGAGGIQGINAGTLYTVEAIGAYLDGLAPDGVLALTRWLRLPPRESVKLFATAIAALEARGVSDPGRHLALIRSWDAATLLVGKDPLAEADVAAVRAFAADRSFDIAWLPGVTADEVNRYNLLERPYLHEGAVALLGPERDDFIDRYKFAIAPATDDRPYYFDMFRWRALPELLALPGQGGAALLDLGYLILLATLVQATILSAVLILLPLRLGRRPLGREVPKLRPALYFLALGLGFLFIEIAFIQRFTLFLGHPLSAVAVALAGFLVFAGLGSAAADWWRSRIGRGDAVRGIAGAAVAIAALAALYLIALPWLLDRLIVLPEAARIVVALVLIAPLAFCMGLPFPLGLAHVGARFPALIPWAWGINGCASVLSALLATLLAMHIGFTGVVAIAVGLYLLAAVALRAIEVAPARLAR